MKKDKDSLARLYLSEAGRDAADAAIDALPMSTTLAEAVDAWDEAYFRTTGHSPFRTEKP